MSVDPMHALSFNRSALAEKPGKKWLLAEAFII